ncbi:MULTISPECIES: hypothetical protein [unclassified Erwinia]|uniref:hypothetical protein n=1 Tax=unclassified Erwinia TaxID=2622719 RepID=UPI0006F5D072|nr:MULTISPECIES: hypothetical protein [unclassified Erwinia]KQN63752.1 hypothetical protein ASF13_19450 [Erwinia sp. Leaf53]PLV57887.1 hypothetical protein NV64_15085 [Erwinia sp. B116]
MKRAIGLLAFSTFAVGAVDLPYIAVHSNDARGGGNSIAVYSLNAGTPLLAGPAEYPVLSDNPARTVATYVPASVTEAGIASYDEDARWKYQIEGFSGTGFKGSFCVSCPGGITPPVAVSDTAITLKYNVLGGIYSSNGLILSDTFLHYLATLPPGAKTTINTSVKGRYEEKSQSNTLLKRGDMTLHNASRLEFVIDPISGEVSLHTANSRNQCTPYTRLVMPGMLCSILNISYQGSMPDLSAGPLKLTASGINPLLTKFNNRGLSIDYTFDEQLWSSLSNATSGSAKQLANSLIAAAAKNGGNATMKVFFPNDFIMAVATQGQASDLTDIVTLCLNPDYSRIGADFCFKPGEGVSIRPIAPSIEIRPDNPDYKLDPNGFGGSGKGKIGDSKPVTIPFTLLTTAKEPAMAISVSVTGSSQALRGQDYCLFRGVGAASNVTVPVPGFLLAGLGQQRYPQSCNGQKIAIPDPSHSPTSWEQQPSGINGYTLWRAPLILGFTMNDPVSTKTFSGDSWDGVVDAEGTIEVKATWK